MSNRLLDPARAHGEVPTRGRSRVRAGLKVGPVEANVDMDVTPSGLLAVGALVSAILLSVVPIVVAGTRKLPPADGISRLGRRSA